MNKGLRNYIANITLKKGNCLFLHHKVMVHGNFAKTTCQVHFTHGQSANRLRTHKYFFQDMSPSKPTQLSFKIKLTNSSRRGSSCIGKDAHVVFCFAITIAVYKRYKISVTSCKQHMKIESFISLSNVAPL